MDNKNQRIQNGIVAPTQGATGANSALRPARRRRTTGLLWWLSGLGVVLLAGAALFFAGVDTLFDQLASVQVGAMRTESQAVPPGSAGAVAANVDMGSGTLTISGGATGLLDAGFSYNVAAWQPQISYSETSAHGALTVRQPRAAGFVRTPDNVHNAWNLRLKNGVPLALAASLGTGSSVIKVDGLALTRLDLSSGAGNITLDLAADWRQSLTATLTNGAGDTTILLPPQVGVRLLIQGGAGHVDSGGFSRSGNYYTNSLYGKTPVTLEIAVQTGSGNVTLAPAH
jgi:N-terminal domain of toast_rack, DUF2154